MSLTSWDTVTGTFKVYRESSRNVMTSGPVKQALDAAMPAVAATLTGMLVSVSACAPEQPAHPEVVPGIEILAGDSAGVLSGLRVGLITNHTGLSRDGTPAARLLLDAGIDLRVLLAPEHGLRGRALPGQAVLDAVDPATGLSVHSLYGQRRTPDPSLLHDLDALVFDVQDVGARYYTYVSTMAEAMRAAARAGVMFVVADRPNPIGGELVQGNVLDSAFASFVGQFPVPMRHGMTVGELALMFNREFGIGARLVVVPAAGWARSVWADQTGVPWIATSPNMPSLESATHYPGTCLFEGTNLSVGRGTDRPFQQIGAPWLDAEEVLGSVPAASLPGVSLVPVSFTPIGADDGKFEGETAQGIRLEVTDRNTYDPTRTAVVLLRAIRRSAGADWAWRPEAFDRLAGTDQLRTAVESGASVDEIVEGWARARQRFQRRRSSYLLYP
ncbi:MAG: DUF1343 domain-containing protein [marine benthic group bacterium]|nr:DUF1343 domain-containing protein [Gemmatimonadota bacterium]